MTKYVLARRKAGTDEPFEHVQESTRESALFARVKRETGVSFTEHRLNRPDRQFDYQIVTAERWKEMQAHVNGEGLPVVKRVNAADDEATESTYPLGYIREHHPHVAGLIDDGADVVKIVDYDHAVEITFEAYRTDDPDHPGGSAVNADHGDDEATLYEGNKTANEYTLSVSTVASLFLDWLRGKDDPDGEELLDAYPVERLVRMFITDSTDDNGLNSVFEEDDYPAIHEAVMTALRRADDLWT